MSTNSSLVIRTGLQGNGKTLNTIKEVDLKAHAEGRTVYYCNITGFEPGHPVIKANWVPFDDPTKWYELPENIDPRYIEYARANASIGINSVVLNNVNASARFFMKTVSSSSSDRFLIICFISKSLTP